MMINRLFQRLVLSGVLTTGLLAAWGVVGMWAVETGAHIAGMDEGRQSLLFLADGTPRLAHIDSQDGEWQYWDLEGNGTPGPSSGVLVGRQLAAVLPDGASSSSISWDERIRSFTDGGSPAVYWYFVWDGQSDGTAYFVGYDSQSRGRVGFLGTAGFRREAVPREELIPFSHSARGPTKGVLCILDNGRYGASSYPGGPDVMSIPRAPHGSVSAWDVYVIGRGGRIYHADLQKRTVDVVLEEPQLCSAALVPAVPDPMRGTPFRLAARTDEAVLVLDERGQLLKRYPIPEPLRGRDIQFVETSAGDALMYWNSPKDALATKIDYRVYWVTPDGRLREVEVSLPASGEMRELRVLGAFVMPAPLVLGGLLVTFGPGTLLEQGRHSDTYRTALRRVLVEFWPALVIAQLLAAGLAILCYRRQVRYRVSRSERVVWPLFVLALGLPGWIAYRFGQTWPVLEACPACGANVPRDRGECARCEAHFQGPTLKGTEIFA